MMGLLKKVFSDEALEYIKTVARAVKKRRENNKYRLPVLGASAFSEMGGEKCGLPATKF